MTGQETFYSCVIERGQANAGPLFHIIPSDAPQLAISGYGLSDLFKRFIAQFQSPPTGIKTGEEFFGLTHPYVFKAIQVIVY